jgi:hypothetical protein
MKNTDVYIGIGDKQFVGKEVNVSMQYHNFNIKPTLMMNYQLRPRLYLTGDVGYNIVGGARSRMAFDGTDQDNQSINATEKIYLNGMTTEVNDVPVSRYPINTDGLFVHLGVKLVLKKATKTVSTTPYTPTYTQPKVEEEEREVKPPVKTVTPPRKPRLKETPKEKPKVGY